MLYYTCVYVYIYIYIYIFTYIYTTLVISYYLSAADGREPRRWHIPGACILLLVYYYRVRNIVAQLLYYVMLCYVMLCYAMLCYII